MGGVESRKRAVGKCPVVCFSVGRPFCLAGIAKICGGSRDNKGSKGDKIIHDDIRIASGVGGISFAQGEASHCVLTGDKVDFCNLLTSFSFFRLSPQHNSHVSCLAHCTMKGKDQCRGGLAELRRRILLTIVISNSFWIFFAFFSFCSFWGV